MRKLLVDVTRTVQSGQHTGIQRVVRRLFGALQVSDMRLPFEVQAVTFCGERWFALDHLPSHPMELGLPTPTFEGPRSLPQPLEPSLCQSLVPVQGDILLMADASWYLDPWPAVDAALRGGAILVGFVHDLLPLQQAQWFRPELQPRFAAHLERLFKRASLLLTPSKAVQRGVEMHLAHYFSEMDAPAVHCQPLGANFLRPACTQRAGYEAVSNLAAPLQPDTEFALMVGTIEPRKNHALMLDAFEMLWQEGAALQLVLVGAPGWCSDALMARIKTHPQWGRQLHWLTCQDDTQLYTLYRHARVLVFPSLDEGFGLPLAEAAHLGCPVLASDLPVLHEVGGPWPTYLPAHDASRWADALRQLSTAPAQAAPTTTWATMASQLLVKLRSLGLQGSTAVLTGKDVLN